MLCNHRTISIRLFNNLSDIQTPIQQQLNALIFLLLQVITHPNNNTLTNTNTTHTTPSQTTTHITTTTPTLSTLSPHTTNTVQRCIVDVQRHIHGLMILDTKEKKKLPQPCQTSSRQRMIHPCMHNLNTFIF